MKPASSYGQEAISAALEKHGAFFAFSNAQLAAQAKPGVKYATLGAGMICPADNCKALSDELNAACEQARAQDLAENGKKGVIRRELANYECTYTGDIDDAVDALEDYGITREEVEAEFLTLRA